MNRDTNTYQLSYSGQTTGWKPSCNDVNGTNLFNMTPAQVAVQAGDVNEFREIVSHPHFNPEKMGTLGIFFTVCREQTPERYHAFMEYFNNEFRKSFHFDASRQVFVRTQ